MLYPAELGAHVDFSTSQTLPETRRKWKSTGGDPRATRDSSFGRTRYPVRVSNEARTAEAHPDPAHAAALARAEKLIRELPGYPQPGILFRDITPLLADGEALRVTSEALIAPFAGQFDVVAGIEARGFLLASAAAVLSGAGMVPVRKAGKLPQPAVTIDYALEYGTASIEMHADLAPGTRVLVIDDVLATGGTVAATLDMLEQLGYPVCGTSVLFEIDGLGGRDRVSDHPLHTVFRSA
ncbi:MAG: adenine phosphoribosyltransferase [Leucobacter sp.]|nr:adenine phosphoribosyltransferase [Leucobacter sp.]